MINELRSAVSTKLKTVIANTTFAKAKSNITYPYAVFSSLTGNVDDDSSTTFLKDHVVVNMYSKDLSAIEALAESVFSLFHENQSAWSMTNYYVTEIKNEINRTSNFDKVFMITHQYSFDLEPK